MDNEVIDVAVVATVFNEEANIRRWFDSLLTQTVQPSEILIVDAGSKDKTHEILQELSSLVREGTNFRLIVEERCSRSTGRNIGIQQALSKIIATTDAGCVLEDNWLEEITAPLRTPISNCDVAAGWFVPEITEARDKVVALALFQRVDEINPETFLPSSRSFAFRKEAWAMVGGYPENLNFGEDTEFDLRLKGAGYRFSFVPSAIVRWKPRSDIRKTVKASFSYGRGDGVARFFGWHKGRLIRYIVWSLGTILAILFHSWYLATFVVATLVGYWSYRFWLISNRRDEIQAFTPDSMAITPLDCIKALGLNAAFDFGLLCGLVVGFATGRE